jgi:phenylacetate-CoA ligase
MEAFQAWRPILPELKFIEFTGEFVDKEVANQVCSFFDAAALDQYGMLETWTIAVSCPHGVLHINDHNVYVEIIDERDRPVRFGEVGRIVVTSLQERLLPFVRYVTDDFGMFIEKECDCRAGSRTIALKKGRSGNVIKGAPGRVFGDVFFMEVFKRIDGYTRRAPPRCEDPFGLTYIRIRQTALDSFTVHTNAIRKPVDLIANLEKETAALLRRNVAFLHIITDDAEISIQERRKPWLFRCEC